MKAKKQVKAKPVAKKAKPAAAKKPRARKTPGKKSVTFTLHADKGKAVYLAGQFNDWNPAKKKMAYRARSGVYTTEVMLAPGTYEYKFVVDGAWCADPENADSVCNDRGTYNSRVTVA